MDTMDGFPYLGYISSVRHPPLITTYTYVEEGGRMDR